MEKDPERESIGKSPLDKHDAAFATHNEHADHLPADPDAGRSDAERAAEDQKLVRKLDLILIPWLCLLYLASFLDRTNIGNAKIEGLTKTLNISGGQYNAALSIFFVSYALFEPLTNILLKRLRPSIFIPIIMIIWGFCMLGMGFVKNFSGLAAARWFLGLSEAGLFPGINFYLSSWYKKKEFGIRAAIFFSSAALAGSFGGLLAAAISQMDGLRGIKGWQWIFILEGIATVLIGIASFWMVHDFPDTATFLSADDRARVVRRLDADKQSSAHGEKFQMTYFWESVKDWKTWTGAIVYMGVDGPLYAFSLFLPSIIADLGYTSTKAQLLSVPPYAAAAIMTIAVGWIADRTMKRGLCNIIVSLLGVAGFGMLLGAQSPGVRYAGTFLGALGIYPCIANTIVWTSNNVEGVFKRGVTLGFVIGWGNLNGVMSSNVYLARDAPRYRIGHGVVFAYLTLFLLGGSIVQHFLLEKENQKRRSGARDHWAEGKSEAELRLMGDKRPDFMYVT